MTFSAASVLAMLESRGQVVTLRRLGNSPPDEVECTGKIDGDAAASLAGQAAQFRRRVIISDVEIAASGWPGPPVRGDLVIADGARMAVMAVDTVVIGTETVMHRLELLGA